MNTPDRGDELRALVDLTMHDVRKLNARVKAEVESLLRDADRVGEIELLREQAHTIFALSSLLSVRLNVFDALANPGAGSAGSPQEVPVYKVFDKVRRCLRTLADRENLRIRLEGNSYSSFPMSNDFELVPFILLDNAIKYSPPKQEILVAFRDESKSLVVRIESIGPRVDPLEVEKLTHRRFRGHQAEMSEVPGSGLGLFAAQQICNINEVRLSLRPEWRTLYELNGVPYSGFRAELVFSRDRRL